MDTLDSRTLAFVDCYAQQFTAAGQMSYSLASAEPHAEGADAPYVIVVGDRPTDPPRQHHVTVHFKARHFFAEPARLEISLNDIVTWHAGDAATPRFTVRGGGPRGQWSSSALGPRSLYTHVFGLRGEYPWIDAIGGKVSGMIVVNDAPVGRDAGDHRAWMKALRTGALVEIDGAAASPTRIDVVVGQTVFFAIKDVPAPGITITDRRLLATR